MNDLVMYGLAFVMGALSFRLVFGGSKPGPFEQSLMMNLVNGKRVIVSIDDEAFIFELHGTKMSITRGVSNFIEETYDNAEPVVASTSDQSGNDDSIDSKSV